MTLIGAHPLDGSDEDKCYDVLLSERNSLLSAKRSAEDEAVKGIIKASSAILLLIPSALITWNVPISDFQIKLISAGAALILIALISAFSEQMLSSWAYNKQIATVTSYYQRLSKDVSHKLSGRLVTLALIVSYTSFTIGVTATSLALLSVAKVQVMTQRPTPPPPAPRPPSPQQTPGHKDGGRSIPPAAPPPPPSKK
jgi:hypothetical protein